jgi:hypothetical protein
MPNLLLKLNKNNFEIIKISKKKIDNLKNVIKDNEIIIRPPRNTIVIYKMLKNVYHKKFSSKK